MFYRCHKKAIHFVLGVVFSPVALVMLVMFIAMGPVIAILLAVDAVGTKYRRYQMSKGLQLKMKPHWRIF